MEFWSNGKKCNTDTMTAKERIVMLADVEAEINEVHQMIAEFNRTSDTQAFSLRHFGRDADRRMYTDRVYVANRLEWMLNDRLTSDRVEALRVMGVDLA